MSTAVSKLAEYRDAACAAILDADYATALRYALAAQAIIASLPRMSRGGRGGQEMEWDSRAIAATISDCRKQQAGAAGIRSTQVVRYDASDLAGEYA